MDLGFLLAPFSFFTKNKLVEIILHPAPVVEVLELFPSVCVLMNALLDGLFHVQTEN